MQSTAHYSVDQLQPICIQWLKYKPMTANYPKAAQYKGTTKEMPNFPV